MHCGWNSSVNVYSVTCFWFWLFAENLLAFNWNTTSAYCLLTTATQEHLLHCCTFVTHIVRQECAALFILCLLLTCHWANDEYSPEATVPLSSPSTLSSLSYPLSLRPLCGSCFFFPAPSFSIRKWGYFLSLSLGLERERASTRKRRWCIDHACLSLLKAFVSPRLPIHHRAFGGKRHKEGPWPHWEPFGLPGAKRSDFAATGPPPFADHRALGWWMAGAGQAEWRQGGGKRR